jgi:hypothetical protein
VRRASTADVEAVERLLGRPPRGDFAVVARAPDGTPTVIENEPLLDDGTPMPTRYWLVDRDLVHRISVLESAGGVKRAERALDEHAVASAHASYARGRDALIASAHEGPRPSGGVGGTRKGVKCLHAHYANWLVNGDDPVGAWVDGALREAAAAGATG